jgi:hypothetical protein
VTPDHLTDHHVLDAEPAMFTMNTRCFTGSEPGNPLNDPEPAPEDEADEDDQPADDVSIADDGEGDPDEADDQGEGEGPENSGPAAA